MAYMDILDEKVELKRIEKNPLNSPSVINASKSGSAGTPDVGLNTYYSR